MLGTVPSSLYSTSCLRLTRIANISIYRWGNSLRILMAGTRLHIPQWQSQDLHLEFWLYCRYTQPPYHQPDQDGCIWVKAGANEIMATLGILCAYVLEIEKLACQIVPFQGTCLRTIVLHCAVFFLLFQPRVFHPSARILSTSILLSSCVTLNKWQSP